MTAVHKANIMKMGDGLFLDIACARSPRDYPDIVCDDRIVDAACMHLVMNPTQFDVLLLPNLYGDIVSDLVRRPGRRARRRARPRTSAPRSASSRPCTAARPTSPGKSVANPMALLLSALLMLRHIGEGAMADRIMKALGEVLSEGNVRTRDLGGTASTIEFADAICRQTRGLGV